jgi:hypothetical protein
MKTVLLDGDDGVAFAKRHEPALQYVTLSNPARTEVRDENGNWLATFTNGSRTVNVKGSQRSFTQFDVPLEDSFTRTRSGSGWGLSTFGGTWVLAGGTNPGNWSVNGNEGEINVDTVNVSRRMYLGTQLSDPDIKVKVKTNKLSAGDTHGASILFNYQDISNHHLLKMDFVSRVITDSFARTTSNGWGSTPDGRTWTTSGGTSSNYAVSAGLASHSISALNSSRRTLIGSAIDSDVTVSVRTNVTATGNSFGAAVVSRWTDASNHYILRVRFSSTQTVHLLVQKMVGGTVTDIGSEVLVGGLNHAANTFVRVRAQTTGNQLRMKVWADGGSEPASWQLSVSDSTFMGAGQCGLRSLLFTGVSNPLPVTFGYADFSCTTEDGLDTVDLHYQKRIGGTTTNVGSGATVSGLNHLANSYVWLRVRATTTSVSAKAWADGAPEPASWQLTEATDSSFTSGKVGLRAVLDAAATNAPVLFTFDDFYAEGTVTSPPLVQHDHWVRALPQAFTGAVDVEWLYSALNDSTSDALGIAMEYLRHAPSIIRFGTQISGDANYGPLNSSGGRNEGADFNDYLGIPWTYTSADLPEAAELLSLDCSGYVRMVYGYRLGLPLRLNLLDGSSIPRVSGNITNYGMGTLLVANTGAQVTDFSNILPGDIVAFDADTSNPDENEGQIDHVGIYLGLDTDGKHRFVSSRKSPNGPSMSDLGGTSVLNGTGLYSTSFRAIRRF